MSIDPADREAGPEAGRGQARVQILLDELCVKLGFCLPPGEQRRLSGSAPADVDAFTDAVLEAEGVDPRVNKQLRRTVRDTIEWHMRRWAQPTLPAVPQTGIEPASSALEAEARPLSF